jgi:hypothetical protein
VLLSAFANGCTAMTGIEAVSNGVPLFREPKVRNAQRTLGVIAGILGLFLLGLAYLCPAYGIVAMDERQPGYQSILSQLVAAVTGRGAFYYVALASIFVVLTCSAQTSFADFPRVCRLLAEDRFLPSAFAKRGRRLVFTHGIVVLSLLSGLLLVVFRGITDSLIPLFAVGAFSAFLVSQLGMVVHWLRQGGRAVRISLGCNALGAATTAVALVIIVTAKFLEGAWITVIVAPALFHLLRRIRAHYDRIEREIEQPLPFEARPPQPPVVIIPIEGLNRVAEKALEFAVLLSNEITAVHISIENDDKQRLRELWTENVEKPARAANVPVPRLVIIDSPYRRVYEPIVDYVKRTKEEKPDRLIAVVIPELANPRWYEALLHNVYGAGLKTMLYVRTGERTVVIYVPWYLREP